MSKKYRTAFFSAAIITLICIFGNPNSSLRALALSIVENQSQTVILKPGWNIVSTPRILENHIFSTAETSQNFDIYVLNPDDPSRWSTMAGINQTEFQPLFGYFVKNKTGNDQSLILNYRQNVEPNQRLFQRDFNSTGWHSIGPAQPTYTRNKCSNAIDTDNVSKILDPIKNSYSQLIDFTDEDYDTNIQTSINSVRVGNIWKSVIANDADSLNDLRELKGYAVYVDKPSYLIGSQNLDPVADNCAEIDIVPPVITLNGSSSINLYIGDTYTELGATAVDNIDEDIPVMIGGDTVNTDVSATFRITYDAVDSVGNHALQVIRTVNVLSKGSLNISVSTASPSGANAIKVRSITPQVLGVYDIRAVGEDIMVNTVNLNFNSGANAGNLAGTIGNVGLYDESGSLLSNVVTLTADNTTNPDQWQSGGVGVVRNTFTMNWLIPANTTKKLYVKGTTSTITAPAAATVISQLDNVTTVVAINATGMSSSGTAGPNNININSALALPALTINATATYLAVPDPTTSIYDQAVAASSAQVTLGYLKVTAQNEDQTLRRIELTNTAGVGAMNAILSGIALFDGDTPITAFNAPNNGTAACLSGGANVNKVCFINTDILTPITFVLNTPKVLTIKGNVLAAPNELNRLALQVAVGEMETLGKDSAAVAVNAGAINLTTNVGAYNETGTYTVRSNVVEIVKDATSPSGNVRGTFQTHGVWDLNLSGTANTADIGSITFTSLTGLPNVAGNPVTAAMFRLYDYTNGAPINVVAEVSAANGTVAFRGIPAAALRITRGSTQKIALQITTTNVAAWPLSTSLQWSIRSANLIAGDVFGDMTVGPMGVVVAATDTDFGTAAITINHGAGGAAGDTLVNSGGAAFDPATDRAYLDNDGNSAISAGDTRLWVTAGYAYPQLSTVVAGDTDIAAGGFAVAVTADTLISTGTGADTAFVLGTDGLYIDASAAGGVTTVQAADTRLVPGNSPARGLNYAGAVGYGGTIWSIPSTANTVTLQ